MTLNVAAYTYFTPAEQLSWTGLVVSAFYGFGAGFIGAYGGAMLWRGLGLWLSAEAATATMVPISFYLPGGALVTGQVSMSILQRFVGKPELQQACANVGLYLGQLGDKALRVEPLARQIANVAEGGLKLARLPYIQQAVYRAIETRHHGHWILLRLSQGGKILWAIGIKGKDLMEKYIRVDP
jgi:hypothetical protein